MTNAYYSHAGALSKAEVALSLELKEVKRRLDIAIRKTDRIAISVFLGQLENVRSALMRIQVIAAGGAA